MTDKPKIAIIHYSYPPVIGGVEIIVQAHAHLFAENNYSTTVLVGEGKSDHPNINLIEIPELRSLSVLNPKLNEKLLSLPSFPQEIYQLKEKIYKKLELYLKNIDVIIAHNVLSLNLNPSLSLALLDYWQQHPEKKLISWIHDTFISLDNGRFVKKIFVNKDLENLVYHPIEGINYVAISNFLKEVLVKVVGFPEEIITVIYNGINIDSFLDLHPVSSQIIDDFNLKQADLIIFLPSKIMRHKNTHLTIKVFNEILKKRKNVYLIISAKKNPHSKNLEYYLIQTLQLIKDLKLEKNIVFLADEIQKYNISYTFRIVKDFYKLADIVLFFSNYENFGLPVIEAGLTKTLIICSDKKIFHEVSSDNLIFIDIENNSPEKIAEYVLEVCDKNLQIGLLKKVRKEFDFKLIFNNKIIPYIKSLK